MTVTAFASGTKTATVGTEHPLPETPFVNAAGTYQFMVDLQPMAAGDVVELRAYARVLEGGTTRVVYMKRFSDVQPNDDFIAVSVPISTELAVTEGIKFSLKQTAGTGRAFPWKVLKFA